jgi:type I restriction enzyme R subunit
LGFFEQMKGRGVRVISETEMEQVNPGVKRKTRFVLVDAVGVTERAKTDSRPLEKKPSVPFEKLLNALALGNREPAALESLAGRLLRLEKRFDEPLAQEVQQAANGQTLTDIARGLLDALDPDLCVQAIQAEQGLYHQPSDAEIAAKLEQRADAAALALAANAPLRNLLIRIQQTAEQVIDVISRDRVLFAGAAPQAEGDAGNLAASFRDYLEQNKAEIAALQILYGRPYKKRLTEPMLKELESKLRQNRADWTEDRLWNAFLILSPKQVKGRTQAGRFADLVSLVRFALRQQPVLEPFADSAKARFEAWLAQQAAQGTTFTPEQLAWLSLMRDHIASTLSMEPEDFAYAPFSQQGGLGRAHQLFGERLPVLVGELNEVLVG